MAVLAIVCAIGLSQNPAEAAAAGCAKAVLDDWSNGGIDRAHPAGCYRKALAALPEDVRVYSSAPDDIRRALAAQVAGATKTLRTVAGVKRTQSASSAAGGEDGRGFPVAGLLAGSLALVLVGLTTAGFAWRRYLHR
jgi:hypothetical protein